MCVFINFCQTMHPILYICYNQTSKIHTHTHFPWRIFQQWCCFVNGSTRFRIHFRRLVYGTGSNTVLHFQNESITIFFLYIVHVNNGFDSVYWDSIPWHLIWHGNWAHELCIFCWCCCCHCDCRCWSFDVFIFGYIVAVPISPSLVRKGIQSN